MAKMAVADLLKLKGKRKITILTAFDKMTAETAAAAGIDVLLTWGSSMEQLTNYIKTLREAAPNTFIGAGIPKIAYASEVDVLKSAILAREAGADLIYASALEIDKFKALGRQKIPFVGHAGYIPNLNTWFGGPRAVGKTCEEALKVYDAVKAYQDAGAVAVEMECIPADIAKAITEKVDILTFSMGSGADCDGQYLYSTDVLGTHNDHYPRHAKKYANFYEESIKAFTRFREEVDNGIYPGREHIIPTPEGELEKFLHEIEK